MRILSLAAATVGLALLAGCGSKNDPVDVSGKVTIDGQPLADGQIVFEATDGATLPGSGVIKGGQYTAMIVPGAKKVKITATRPGKQKDATMGAFPQEPLIGPEFNTNTKLTAEIKPGKNANQNVDFQVKALP